MEDSGGSSSSERTDELEERVAELERLGEELGRAPDAELSGLLERAVELLEEINSGIESRISAASQETGEAEGLLDRVDFGAFDAALGSMERESPGAGESYGSEG
jgi:hypothetical protein